MNRPTARARLTRTHIAVALSLALASALPSIAATSAPGDAQLESARRHYALRMAQRVERSHDRVPRGRARAPLHVSGIVLPVTSCADDGSEGTLRSVVAAAGEGDTIDLSALACSTITLTQGAIDLSVLGDHHLDDLSIIGPGSAALTIDGNGGRVLTHGDFQVGLGTLAITDLTIANGDYPHGLASCIDSSGSVDLLRTVVTHCSASNGGPLTFGGAVSAAYLNMTSSTISDSRSEAAGDNVAIGAGAYVSGDATLIRSTISGNTTRAETAGDGTFYLTAGGGLYVRGALSMIESAISNNSLYSYDIINGPGGGAFVRADANIAASTFSGNTAVTGGALTKSVFSRYGDPGTKLTIANSTFAVNGAMYHAGGIETSRPTVMANSTVSSNWSMFGGGLFCSGVDVTIQLDSTIIALNAYNDVPDSYRDILCEESVTVTGANNLVIETLNVELPADTIRTDPLFLDSAPVDHGGPTETIAIDPASPAIDSGDNMLGFDYDQRGEGFARVSGAAADVGAFEVQQAIDDEIFADGFE